MKEKILADRIAGKGSEQSESRDLDSSEESISSKQQSLQSDELLTKRIEETELTQQAYIDKFEELENAYWAV